MYLLRRLLLPVILLLLGYAFWQNSNFKQIAAGVAIFLFGMLSIEDGFGYTLDAGHSGKEGGCAEDQVCCVKVG